MKTPIQATKKAQKLVTKSILLLAVFFSQVTLSQENHLSHVFEIIVNDFERKDSTICLLDIYDKGNIKSRLQKYYDFRTRNKPFLSTIALDSTINEYYIDSIPSKERIKFWKKKYSALDVSFSKKEIKSIIDNELSYSEDYLYNTRNPI